MTAHFAFNDDLLVTPERVSRDSPVLRRHLLLERYLCILNCDRILGAALLCHSKRWFPDVGGCPTQGFPLCLAQIALHTLNLQIGPSVHYPLHGLLSRPTMIIRSVARPPPVTAGTNLPGAYLLARVIGNAPQGPSYSCSVGSRSVGVYR